MADFIQNGSGVVIDPSGAGLAVAEVNKLKDKIRSTIYPNGAGAIKAADHQELLLEMADMFTDLDKSKIAKNADDYYPQLSVGTADTLAGVDVVDSNFTFRRSGGGAIADGVARVQSIKGNSIVWNQNIGQINPLSIQVSGNAEGYRLQYVGGDYQRVMATFPAIINHKYLTMIDIKAPSKSLMYAMLCTSFALDVEFFANVDDSKDNVWANYHLFATARETNAQAEMFFCDTQTKSTNFNGLVEMKHPVVYDLTKMFGEGNEPTTIAEFYSRIPMGVELNAYNEGEIIDCKVEGIVSVGRNAWDEQWERGIIGVSDGQNYPSDASIRTKNYIRILPNTEYYKSCPTLSFYWHIYFDQDKKFIGYAGHPMNNKFTTPPNAYYMKSYSEDGYGNTYKNDICINLSDPDFNGQYEPYLAVGEDLSIARKYFPNGMRSAGNARDEIRYNKATNRWEKVQRIAEVDLGDLDWSYDVAQRFVARFDGDVKLYDLYKPIVLSAYGYFGSDYPIAAVFLDKAMSYLQDIKSFYVYNEAYTDAASFKAAMKGVMLYYELAEPIVTEIEETDFNLDYYVWNNGTEQAIAEGKSSALAADITYGFNAVGLIKQLRTIVEAMQAKLANL